MRLPELLVQCLLLEFVELRLECVLVQLRHVAAERSSASACRTRCEQEEKGAERARTSCDMPTGFEMAADISLPSSICSRMSSISCSTLSMLLSGMRREQPAHQRWSGVATESGPTYRLPCMPLRMSLPRFMAFMVSMFMLAFSMALT